jgi:hypothetical protein
VLVANETSVRLADVANATYSHVVARGNVVRFTVIGVALDKQPARQHQRGRIGRQWHRAVIDVPRRWVVCVGGWFDIVFISPRASDCTNGAAARSKHGRDRGDAIQVHHYFIDKACNSNNSSSSSNNRQYQLDRIHSLVNSSQWMRNDCSQKRYTGIGDSRRGPGRDAAAVCAVYRNLHLQSRNE